MLIDHQKEADDTFLKLLENPFVTIDSEFKWMTTYAPLPALLQVGTPDNRVYLFDLAAIKDFTTLKIFLESEKCLKVFHSCGQDLILFNHICGAVTKPIFDTQVAYSFISRRYQIGYGNLVEELFGEILSKGSQQSDWLKRPLSEKQLEYAKNDVVWLLKVYELLKVKLTECHRLSWVEEECRLYTKPSFYKDVKPEDIFRTIKGVNKLNKDQLAVMRELCAWREEIAKEVDLRPRRILSEEALYSIVFKLPRNTHDLKNCRDISPMTMRYNSRDIIDCVDVGLGLDDYQKPPVVEHHIPSKSEEALAQRLYERIDKFGEEVKICTPVLLSRQECNRLAHWRVENLPIDFKFLLPWRQNLLQEIILEVLNK